MLAVGSLLSIPPALSLFLSLLARKVRLCSGSDGILFPSAVDWPATD